MSYGTSFDETEAILAAQSGDRAELGRIIGRMLPHERAELLRACRLLESEIRAHDDGLRTHV